MLSECYTDRPKATKKEKMNSLYKVFNLILFIHNLFIIVGILLAVIALRVNFMLYYLALNGDTVFFQWIVIFILFLIEFLFYLKKIINRKNLIFSIIVIIIHYYLTYLCMFTHTPDFFTLADLIFSTKRFFSAHAFNVLLVYFARIIIYNSSESKERKTITRI